MIVTQFDGRYFRWEELFLRSLYATNPGEQVRLNTVNLTAQQVSRLLQCYPGTVVENEMVSPPPSRETMANRRVAVFMKLFKSFREERFLFMDADMLFRKPLDDLYAKLEGHDAALVLRDGYFAGRYSEAMRVACGTVLVTRAARALMDKWYELIHSRTPIDGFQPWKWMWDQICLWEAHKQSPSVRCASLREDVFCDRYMRKDASVWSANLPHQKDRQYRVFLAETCRLEQEAKDASTLPRVLIGIPVKNCARFIPTLVDQLIALDYPRHLLSVGMLENDSRDNSWQEVCKAKGRLEKAGIATGIARRTYGFDIPHTSRHRTALTSRRRWCMCQARQAIVDLWFRGHDAVMWLDADFVLVPPSALKAIALTGQPIVIPTYRTTDGRQYDWFTAQRVKGNWRRVPSLRAAHPELTMIPVDRVDGACYMTKDVLARHSFISGLDRDSPDFTQHMRKDTEGLPSLGFPMFLHREVVIQHALIDGFGPVPKTYRVRQVSPPKRPTRYRRPLRHLKTRCR